jgi:hypothetical protein
MHDKGGNALIIILLGICVLGSLFFGGCFNYSHFSPEELAEHDSQVSEQVSQIVQVRMSNEFAQLKPIIIEEARRQLLDELKAQKKPEPENNFRNTRWGMSMEEVIAAEGTPLKRTESSLVYKVHTAGLPSLVRFIFDGGVLTKADVQFNNPKFSAYLPNRPAALVEADFKRMVDVLTEKYNRPQVTEQEVSNIEQLLREQERLNDSLVDAQRRREDLRREYDREYARLSKQFDGWRDKEAQIRKYMKDKDYLAQRLDDAIVEIQRNQDDIAPKIREEQFRKQDGKLFRSTVCRWYEPSLFDITLTMTSSEQGCILSGRYNGYITPNLSAAPSDF